MIKIPTNPGEWLHFVKRNDNIGLSLIEIKEKYRDEKILFESTIKRNYMTPSNYSRLQDLYLLVTATDIINDITRQDLLEFLDVQH